MDQPDFGTLAQVIATLFVALAIEAGTVRQTRAKYKGTFRSGRRRTFALLLLIMAVVVLFLDCLMLVGGPYFDDQEPRIALFEFGLGALSAGVIMYMATAVIGMLIVSAPAALSPAAPAPAPQQRGAQVGEQDGEPDRRPEGRSNDEGSVDGALRRPG